MFDSRMHPWELISKDGYGLECVVVAVGYRLNIFGFLGADADGLLPGNWGFWDQRCAIEWISANIKHFGGDNTNVTLGGVSAGTFPRRNRSNSRCILTRLDGIQRDARRLRTVPSDTL
jgi:carboxylesterase type B